MIRKFNVLYFLNVQSRLVEELVRRAYWMDQNTKGQKEQQSEIQRQRETWTSNGCGEALWGRRGCIGWTRWMQKETLRRENWKFGRGRAEGVMRGVNEGRKDHGFRLATIWDSDEQLSWRPGGKNENENNVEVGSTGGRKEDWMSGGGHWT